MYCKVVSGSEVIKSNVIFMTFWVFILAFKNTYSCLYLILNVLVYIPFLKAGPGN